MAKSWKRSLAQGLSVAAVVLAGAGLAWAQQDNDGMRVLQSIDGSVKSGWVYLKTAAALIVGGGFLAAGGRAMTKGDWTGGSVGIGFGALVLVAFFALGKTLGLN